MATIKVVKAFNLLLAPNEAPLRFEVGEQEVEQHVADHWYVQAHLEGSEEPVSAETPATLDPATASRDEVLAYLRASLAAHLESQSDAELRDFAEYQIRRAADEADADEDEDDDDHGEEGEGAEAAADTLQAGAGNDTISGAGSEAGSAELANDTLTGAAGDDSLGSTGGVDTLSGGQGDDTLAGSAGGDTLANPDEAKDSIEAGAGNDTLVKNPPPKTRKA